MKLRQPLAELRIQPNSDADRRAIKRFSNLIMNELNVKKVTLHEGMNPMLNPSAKLNKKTAASKLGLKLKEAEIVLDRMDGTKVAENLRTGSFTLIGVKLENIDITISYLAPEGWAGVVDKGIQVMIDTRLTPELKAEGLARDIIRLIQDTRKNVNLNVADKIILYLGTESSTLKNAIEVHKEIITNETQVIEWSLVPLDGMTHTIVKVDGQQLTINFKKVLTNSI